MTELSLLRFPVDLVTFTLDEDEPGDSFIVHAYRNFSEGWNPAECDFEVFADCLPDTVYPKRKYIVEVTPDEGPYALSTAETMSVSGTVRSMFGEAGGTRALKDTTPEENAESWVRITVVSTDGTNRFAHSIAVSDQEAELFRYGQAVTLTLLVAPEE